MYAGQSTLLFPSAIGEDAKPSVQRYFHKIPHRTKHLFNSVLFCNKELIGSVVIVVARTVAESCMVSFVDRDRSTFVDANRL